MADSRDLTRFVIPDGGVIQNFSLVLVPRMRLHGLARWGARRAAFRAHRSRRLNLLGVR
ncbi:MAG TPA: hypothetical protein VHW01_28380 [Polyangiaceae bacterium]|nr:hypothetical protein [Polyangiaceae bacterium]